jgi:putative chitinase
MTLTSAEILKFTPHAKPSLVPELTKWINFYASQFGMNAKRLQHFMSQAAHETDGFRTLEEYASGAKYEGRKDLGNTVVGDGKKFKGRGIFQITGRTNYTNYSKAIFGDTRLVSQPELLLNPRWAVLSAFLFWKNHGLNALADKDNVLGITKAINGGTNGLEDRKNYLQQAYKIFIESPLQNLLSIFFALFLIYISLKK